MATKDWLEIVASLPLDSGMTTKFLREHGISLKTLHKLTAAPFNFLENETRKMRYATYRKTENFYKMYEERLVQNKIKDEQRKKENEKKAQEEWEKQLVLFYNLLGRGEYQKAYGNLKWLFLNKRNNIYDRELRFNFILLEEVLGIEESCFVNEEFVIDKMTTFKKNCSYYKYFDEFIDFVEKREWYLALNAIKTYKIFEKGNISYVNSSKAKMYIDLMTTILNKKSVVLSSMDDSRIFAPFYNMIRNGEYENAYTYLTSTLNESNSNNNTYKMYIRVYCILLEKILGCKNSRRDTMKSTEFSGSNRIASDFSCLAKFISAVEVGDFESAYMNLVQYKVVVERRGSTNNLKINALYFLICKVTGRERIAQENSCGYDKNIIDYQKKYKDTLNNLKCYIKKGNYRENSQNILDCIDNLVFLLKKDKKNISFLKQFKNLVMIYRNDRLSSGYVYDSDLDKLDDNSKFEQLIRKGAYYQAFECVGKVLCVRKNDELFKLYARVLINFGSVLTKGEIKVVLDNDEVNKLVCNREFDRLMEIFEVVGKDNLDSKYISLYEKIEFIMMNFKIKEKTPKIKQYGYKFNDSAIDYLKQEGRFLINYGCYKIRIKKN